MLMNLVSWAAARAKEPSTWVGIGGFVALLNPAVGALVGKYGLVVGPLLSGLLIGATTKK